MSNAANESSAVLSDYAGAAFDETDSQTAEGPLRLDVLAVNAADVVRSAGGWLFNRAQHGWTVNVFLAEYYAGTALRILGANVVPLQYFSAVPLAGGRPHLLAASSAMFGPGDHTSADLGNGLMAARARVVVWGDPLPDMLDRRLDDFRHRLTPAGMAFKVHAMRAVIAEQLPPCPSEEFRGRARTMCPCDFDLEASGRLARVPTSQYS